MAVNVWSSTGSTDGNLASNWSLGSLSATDTLTFDSTSVVNCTLTAYLEFASINWTTGYTGTFNANGFALVGGTAGDFTLNIGGAGAELLVNAGFETAGAGDPDFFGTWAETAGDGAIAATTTAGEYRTVTAAKVTAGASANTKLAQTIAVTGSTAYRLIIWCRGDATNTGSYGLYDVTNSANITAKTSLAVTSATYAQKTYDFTTPATCVSLRLDLWCPAANGGIAYFDDISLTTFGTVNLSSSTITCDGNFDWSGAAGTITRGTSTLVMTGTGKNLKATYNASPLRALNAVTVAIGATITIPSTVGYHILYGLLTLNGTLTQNNTSNLQPNGGVTQGISGGLNGTGTTYFAANTLTFANPSAIAPAEFRLGRSVSLPPGTYSPTTLFVVYSNNAGDATFTWQAGIHTFTSPFQIYQGASGTGTFTISAANNPTLIFQSSVTITQLAGTIAFTETNHTNPNQLTGTANQTLNLAAKNMGTWVLNKPSAGTVTFTSGDSIVAGGAWSMTALTEPAGVSIDLGDGGWSHAVSGDVTLDGTAFDMGTSTLTVGGSFDNKDVTTWTRGTSTLVLTGTGKTLTSASANRYHNLTFSNGSSYTLANDATWCYGTLTISGAVVVNKELIARADCDLVFGASGSASGTSGVTLSASTPGHGLTTFPAGASITCVLLTIYQPSSGMAFASGIYSPTTLLVVNDSATAKVFDLSGSFTFSNAVSFTNTNAGGSLEIANDHNNPNITIGGSLTFTQSAGTLTYTKGTGTLTLNSATAATLNTLGQAVEDIVVAKTATANTVTLGSNIVTDSFTLTTGTLVPSGKNITTVGNLTIGIAGQVSAATLVGCVWTVGGIPVFTGEAGDLLTLNPAAGWTLNALGGNGTASYVTVANSDASGGSTVVANNSTNSGNNTNWMFPPIRFPWQLRRHRRMACAV